MDVDFFLRHSQLAPFFGTGQAVSSDHFHLFFRWLIGKCILR